MKGELKELRELIGEFKSANELREHVGSLDVKKNAIKKQIRGYQRIVADFKSAADLGNHVENLRKLVGDFKNANEIQAHTKVLDDQVVGKKKLLAAYSDAIEDARTAQEIKAKSVYYTNLVAQLEEDLEELTEAKQLQEFAFYRPRFDFEKSAEYRQRLDENRAKQKDLLKSESATHCEIEWEVSGSRAKGRQMEKQKIKLMLRAFNGECDAAIAKATYRNVESLGKRIERAFNAINKSSSVDKIQILQPYLDLKLDELHLAYEWEVKKQEEKEEQARIREQMREEKKIAEEVEKAKKAAEKEEREKQKELSRNEDALAQAKAELEIARKKLEAEGNQLKGVASELEARAIRLQTEHDALVASVKEATERKAKAIARAQLTRSGHVYVLSNIGSFGEDCFKIGLSRRLEPLERVKELGSASVPFPFDVHAMIYSEDAPSLETKLHRHFTDRKVNRVNSRKEFFHVELQEIMDAVGEYHGTVTFVAVSYTHLTLPTKA